MATEIRMEKLWQSIKQLYYQPDVACTLMQGVNAPLRTTPRSTIFSPPFVAVFFGYNHLSPFPAIRLRALTAAILTWQ